MSISFDDRVAIVTGAGQGIGRSHALGLAARGARVVVNDMGCSVDGAGTSRNTADQVVAEIRDAGGEAVANYDSVASTSGARAIADCALSAFGTIDILVNNAGILRDNPLCEIPDDQFRAILDTHIGGAFYCSRAVWPVMRDKGRGRIVMTSSGSGLYGHPGQASYCSAKAAVIGLMHALSLEGADHDILVNTVCPIATSRMTEDFFDPAMRDLADPDHVAALVLWLCSDRNDRTNLVFSAGLGYFARAATVEGPGLILPPGGISCDEVDAHIDTILGLDGAREYRSVADYLGGIAPRIFKAAPAGRG